MTSASTGAGHLDLRRVADGDESKVEPASCEDNAGRVGEGGRKDRRAISLGTQATQWGGKRRPSRCSGHAALTRRQENSCPLVSSLAPSALGPGPLPRGRKLERLHGSPRPALVRAGSSASCWGCAQRSPACTTLCTYSTVLPHRAYPYCSTVRTPCSRTLHAAIALLSTVLSHEC
nr:hypothetical protein CFP56_52490 [Quercus suber]